MSSQKDDISSIGSNQDITSTMDKFLCTSPSEHKPIIKRKKEKINKYETPDLHIDAAEDADKDQEVDSIVEHFFNNGIEETPQYRTKAKIAKGHKTGKQFTNMKQNKYKEQDRNKKAKAAPIKANEEDEFEIKDRIPKSPKEEAKLKEVQINKIQELVTKCINHTVWEIEHEIIRTSDKHMAGFKKALVDVISKTHKNALKNVLAAISKSKRTALKK